MTLLQVCTFTSSFFNNCNPQLYIAHFSTDIDSTPAHGWEYLRTGTDLKKLDGRIKAQNVLVDEVQNGNRAFSFYAKAEGADGFVEIPILHYKGYCAKTDFGKLPISDGENNVIRVAVPEHFSGTVTVRFVPPWYWRVAEIVSLISLVFACISLWQRGNYGRK